MSNPIKQKRPKYTLEFKKDAAKLVLENGYSQEEAAKNLGISKSAISRWVIAEKEPSKGTADRKAKPSLEQHAEILRLRKENDQLRMEREILKKAAVFFAKEVE